MDPLHETIHAAVPPMVPNAKRKLRLHDRALDTIERKLDHGDCPIGASIRSRWFLASCAAQPSHRIFLLHVERAATLNATP